jgi:hypothetical protein
VVGHGQSSVFKWCQTKRREWNVTLITESD